MALPHMPYRAMKDDARLCDLVRDGDTHAYAELYTRSHEYVRRYTCKKVGRSHTIDVDDIVSTAFVRVLSALQSGKGPHTKFRSYVCSIVNNLIVDELRRDRSVSSDDLSDFLPPVEPSSNEYGDLAMAKEAFAELPQQWRQVIWLVDVEGWEARELADHLKIKPNAVAALTRRARIALRDAFIARSIAGAAMVSDTCQSTRQELPRYVRGDAPKTAKASVEGHLAECSACPQALEGAITAASGMYKAVVAPLAVLAGSGWALEMGLGAFSGGSSAAAATTTASAGTSSSTGGGLMSTVATTVTTTTTHSLVAPAIAAAMTLGVGAMSAAAAAAHLPNPIVTVASQIHDSLNDRKDVQKAVETEATVAAEPSIDETRPPRSSDTAIPVLESVGVSESTENLSQDHNDNHSKSNDEPKKPVRREPPKQPEKPVKPEKPVEPGTPDNEGGNNGNGNQENNGSDNQGNNGNGDGGSNNGDNGNHGGGNNGNGDNGATDPEDGQTPETPGEGSGDGETDGEDGDNGSTDPGDGEGDTEAPTDPDVDDTEPEGPSRVCLVEFGGMCLLWCEAAPNGSPADVWGCLIGGWQGRDAQAKGSAESGSTSLFSRALESVL